MQSPSWEPSVDRRFVVKQMGLALLAAGLTGGSHLVAEEPRVNHDALPPGKLPNDARLGPLRDLNGYFPFQPPATVEQWKQRAEAVRRRILVACGLWPMPERQPIKAVVHGKVQREGYSVERVYFESAPGLYVTGSLYRPEGNSGPRPAVLCPHGHWANGRFFDHGEAGVKKEIESGAEKYPVGGRYPLQARCVQLARMGCLVFHYDMLGYADSVPLSQQIAHGLREQRPSLQSPDRWGLFSAQAELRLINALGLQTFNSIRCLDWICSLDEVDKDRIGVTGASGGGTQTFMLAAVDARPAAAFPAVMVSTAMQGGCTCENACYLRIETGNIEFAALCAPRPLGMSAANDWTVELETKGLPELKQLYALLGVADRVEGKHFNFPHNYNYVSRAMMYEFFNKHLQLGWESPIVEQDYVPLTREELTVWTAEHPKPPMDEEAELRMLRAWDEASNRRLRFDPQDAASRRRYRQIISGAYDVMIGRTLPAAEDIEFETTAESSLSGYRLFTGLVRNKKEHAELPSAFLLPNDWQGSVVLVFHPLGKQAIFEDTDGLRSQVDALVARGVAVGAVDVLYTGEFTADRRPISQSRRVDNPREIAAYTLGYNHPLFAQRVHDVLTAVAFAHYHPMKPKKLYLMGIDDGALWAAAACLQARGIVDKLAILGRAWRFADITDIRDPNLWPGAVKYGDVPGLLGACAPIPLWIHGEGANPPSLTASCYQAEGAGNALTCDAGERETAWKRMNEWLLS